MIEADGWAQGNTVTIQNQNVTTLLVSLSPTLTNRRRFETTRNARNIVTIRFRIAKLVGGHAGNIVTIRNRVVTMLRECPPTTVTIRNLIVTTLLVLVPTLSQIVAALTQQACSGLGFAGGRVFAWVHRWVVKREGVWGGLAHE